MFHTVHGNWSEPSWSACSVTCDMGTKTRMRQCDNPAPQHGGLDCVGEAFQKSDCNEGACPTQGPPVDGVWTAWSEWSRCDKNCGGGRKYAYRNCTDPAPANGGLNCTGGAELSTSCNSEACIEKGETATASSVQFLSEYD